MVTVHSNSIGLALCLLVWLPGVAKAQESAPACEATPLSVEDAPAILAGQDGFAAGKRLTFVLPTETQTPVEWIVRDAGGEAVASARQSRSGGTKPPATRCKRSWSRTVCRSVMATSCRPAVARAAPSP